MFRNGSIYKNLDTNIDKLNVKQSRQQEAKKITTGLVEELAQIKIYPNPATGSVFIEFPRELKVEVAILDAVGRTLKIDRLTSQQQKMKYLLQE